MNNAWALEKCTLNKIKHTYSTCWCVQNKTLTNLDDKLRNMCPASLLHLHQLFQQFTSYSVLLITFQEKKKRKKKTTTITVAITTTGNTTLRFLHWWVFPKHKIHALEVGCNTRSQCTNLRCDEKDTQFISRGHVKSVTNSVWFTSVMRTCMFTYSIASRLLLHTSTLMNSTLLFFQLTAQNLVQQTTSMTIPYLYF